MKPVLSIVAITIVAIAGWFGLNAIQTSKAIETLAAETRANLIYVKGGAFNAGNFEITVELENGDIERRIVAAPMNALEPYQVTVSDFSMLSGEVLNDSFDLFLLNTGRDPQLHDTAYGRGLPDHPAIMLWQEATAYCQWLGDISSTDLRLPTEVEWEYAARSRGKVVPWGTAKGTWQPGKTIHDQDTPGLYTQTANLWEQSPMGFFDFAGGAHEWVSDVVGQTRIAKGGSTNSDALFETIPSRLVTEPISATFPGEPKRYSAIGYPYHAAFATARCAASGETGQGPGTVDFTAPTVFPVVRPQTVTY